MWLAGTFRFGINWGDTPHRYREPPITYLEPLATSVSCSWIDRVEGPHISGPSKLIACRRVHKHSRMLNRQWMASILQHAGTVTHHAIRPRISGYPAGQSHTLLGPALCCKGRTLNLGLVGTCTFWNRSNLVGAL